MEIHPSRRLLETSLRWQKVVDREVSIEDKQKAAAKAKHVINRIDGFYGANRIFVKSELAILINEEPEVPEDELPAVKFRDVLLRGWLGKANYVQLAEYVAITWSLYDAEVLAHDQVIDTPSVDALIENPYQNANGIVREPLLLPVGFINYALCAA